MRKAVSNLIAASAILISVICVGLLLSTYSLHIFTIKCLVSEVLVDCDLTYRDNTAQLIVTVHNMGTVPISKVNIVSSDITVDGSTLNYTIDRVIGSNQIYKERIEVDNIHASNYVEINVIITFTDGSIKRYKLHIIPQYMLT